MPRKKLSAGNYRDIFSRNDHPLNQKLKKAVIGIAGIGGLGSNAAVALARAGVGRLVIADYDKVELSNLNRQNYSLKDVGKFKTDALESIIKSISPFTIIEKHNARITGKNVFTVFAECAVVIEAFDTVKSKSMIVKAFADGRFYDKYLIAASGVAGYSSSNEIKTKRLSKNIYVCGDGRSDPLTSGSLMAPRIMITAGHQANTALMLINKLFD